MHYIGILTPQGKWGDVYAISSIKWLKLLQDQGFFCLFFFYLQQDCFLASDVTALFIFGCEPRWPDRRCHRCIAAPYIYEQDSLCSIYTLAFEIPEGTLTRPFLLSRRTMVGVGGVDGWICVHPQQECVHLQIKSTHTHLHSAAVRSGPSQQCLAECSFSESFHLTSRAWWPLLRRLAAAHTLRDCRVRPLLTTSPP